MNKKFLNKVTDQLVSETEVDSEKEEIYFQFLPLDEIYGINSFHIPYFDIVTIYTQFLNHCRDVYGLNDDEIDYVWDEYENTIKSMTDVFSNSIYLEESNHISDKDNNFLDEVVNQIVRETEVDYVSKKVKLRFTSSYTYLDIVDAYIFPYPPFEEHLKGVYGLKNMSERKYVQHQYEYFINKMLNTKGDINESTGMDNKFLDKVIYQIVSETRIEKVNSVTTIHTPFSQRTFSSHEFSQGKDLNSRYSDVKALYHYFSIHCQDIYGLDSSEIDYAFQKYRNIIMLKINGVIESRSKENLNTITESEEITLNDNKFLQTVLNYLKEDTKVVIEPSREYDGYIIAPIGYGFRFDFYGKSLQENGDFVNEWWKEMKEMYSLRDKEVLFLIGAYKDFLWETLEKISSGEYLKGEVNESKKVDKKISLSDKDKRLFYQAYQEMGMDEEWYENNLLDILDWLNGLPEETILYRLLYVDDDEKIDKEFLGDHYTPNKKELLYNHYNKGSIYGGNEGHPVLIKVKINKEQIDIFNTIHNNIYYPHEEEITLKNKGKNVKIIDITKL